MTIEALGSTQEPWAVASRSDAGAGSAGVDRAGVRPQTEERTGWETGGSARSAGLGRDDFDLIAKLRHGASASLSLDQVAAVEKIDRKPRTFTDGIDLGNPYERIFGSLRTAAARRDATLASGSSASTVASSAVVASAVTQSVVAQAVVGQAAVAQSAAVAAAGSNDPSAGNATGPAVPAVTPTVSTGAAGDSTSGSSDADAGAGNGGSPEPEVPAASTDPTPDASPGLAPVMSGDEEIVSAPAPTPAPAPVATPEPTPASAPAPSGGLGGILSGLFGRH
jgi:hypothetical protein